MNVLCGFLVAVVLASCGAAGNRCSTEPEGRVNAFFLGDESSRDVVATLSAIVPLETGGVRYDLQDGSRLTWLASEPIAPLKVGGTYRFVVDYAPGSPDASGILIFDGGQLLFAALTDRTPFLRVLKRGIPGFSVALEEGTCGSRGRTKCHSALVNLPLSIAHRGTRVVLHHGERAKLGAFEVRVLTAQKVTYAPRCADAGLPGVSFVIRRVE